MAEYYLVDVKSITSHISRSEFKVEDLERLAQNILTSGGLLSPVLLKQSGAENYEVLSGDLEYYAAVRAKEINPRAGEMVNAFIVPPKQQEAAVAQIAALAQVRGTPTTAQKPTVAVADAIGSDTRLTNLESRLDEAIREIKQSQAREIKRLEQDLQEIKSQFPTRVEPLEALNTLSPSELIQKLKIANIKGETAKKMVDSIDKERKKAKFTSFSDAVQRIQGLGEKRMLSMIDAWAGLN